MADEQITLSVAEVEELRRLARAAGTVAVPAAVPVTLVPDGWENAVRKIVRQEVGRASCRERV